MKKYVYFFGGGEAEGHRGLKNLLGGKGANLHEMTRLGIQVPPGFTISTEACIQYFERNGFAEGLEEEIREGIAKLEKLTGKGFGDTTNPLLFSVRSGARVSMPGMMDTVLNLGLNQAAVQGLSKASQNERFAQDAYRRFLQMFGDIVLGVRREEFETLLEAKKKGLGITQDSDLDQKALHDLVEAFKATIKKHTGETAAEDPWDQLFRAVRAVFESWDTNRAVEYRKIHRIPGSWGTAVNVQVMVFGNLGDDSGTGVAFSRDPSTGEKKIYGEYLINAQGEDVVAGVRTPHPFAKLEQEMPRASNELTEIFERLENHYRDMMDMEFTIERGTVYMLQTRVGKRTGRAEVKIAIDLVKEGAISKEEALLRVNPKRVEELLHPRVDPNAKMNILVKGLPASPGAVSGAIVFQVEEAVQLAEENRPAILVRMETSPDDIKGMALARGILTARGGMTSHAAVVARGMGKPCVVGAEALDVDYSRGEIRVNGQTIRKGETLTLDGSTGNVLLGEVPTVAPELFPEFEEILSLADEIRWMGVRANADTPEDAQKARAFGAEGIGLARTEHMFFKEDRISWMQAMILARTPEERRQALDKLLPMQREDFEGLFMAMEGFPVTIRTLDPPLHEFLPKTAEDTETLSKRLGISAEDIQAKAESLAEQNPMLGYRGCRLGISYPEITEMQARAIFEAAIGVQKKGHRVFPEIMIPLVSDLKELERQKAVVERVAQEVMERENTEVGYTVGTMIELPRAALLADEIATEAQFFSFGTNDLTQTTFGFSRDDAGKFLPKYVEEKILPEDPFQVLDTRGVGVLIEIAVAKGKTTRPALKVGICGEHGGDPESVKFCHRTGLDYVSASPFRVPVARLAAAQAVLEAKRARKGRTEETGHTFQETV